MATNEAKVISAVCANKDAYVILGEDRELFGGYADVFDFIKEYYIRHRSVPDKGIINDRFNDIDFVETTAPTKFYLEELKSAFVSARLESIITKAASALSKGQASGEILEKMQLALARTGKYTNSARDLSLIDAENAEAYFEKLQEMSEGKGGQPGIATGFKSIDAFYPTGMAPGHLITLLGYTGRGKSMWAALLAVKAWEQGFKPMVISLEMSAEEYRERVYAMMSSGLFNIDDLARGNIDRDNFRTWANKKFMDSNDFIVTDNTGISSMTPNVIQSKIDTHRPDIVILDYMQLCMDNAKTQGMTPRMLNMSREDKMLAVTNGIPIVQVSSVTDEDNDKRDAPPLLSQIAWSSGIEYDSNLAIAIHRHDESNLVEAVMRKNRHGDLADFFFEVDFNKGIWTESFEKV